ncbi:MAG: hypothetical protein WCJ39_07965 [bacterium]
MYYFQSYGDQFASQLHDIWGSFISFVPGFLFAIILFIIGWIVGSIVGKAVAQVITSLKVDKALASAGVDDVMEKAGLKLNVGGFIGGLIKWFIIAVFLMTSLVNLQLTSVAEFIRTDVLGYLPHVIVASLILIIATVIAEFMSKVITASSKAGGFTSAGFLGTLTRYSIFIFAFILALSELQIAGDYMRAVFIGLIAMFSLAGGLAFGLGGKEAASRAIEHVRDRVKPM